MYTFLKFHFFLFFLNFFSIFFNVQKYLAYFYQKKFTKKLDKQFSNGHIYIN